MDTLLLVLFYLLALSLVFIFATLACYVARKVVKFFTERQVTKAAVRADDHEANLEQFPSPTLPAGFYLDSIVYPPATKKSAKPTSCSPENPTINTGSDDNKQKNACPPRPPRPTRLDDLLAGFPFENLVSKDIWFPITNTEKARWELGVVRDVVTLPTSNSHLVYPIITITCPPPNTSEQSNDNGDPGQSHLTATIPQQAELSPVPSK